MKFSIIGSERSVADLVRELLRSSVHTLESAAISGELLQSLTEDACPVRLSASPEEAMLEPAVQVVVIAVPESEECLRMTRAALQAGRHVVVLPPQDASPAFAFELHLILDESQNAIVPITGRFLLQDLPSGCHGISPDRQGVQQISLELPLSVGNAVNAQDISDGSERRQRDILLQRDIAVGLDLLAACGYRYTQVTAIESRAPDGRLISMLVTLNSSAESEVPEPPATLHLKTNEAISPAPAISLRSGGGEIRKIEINPTADRLRHIEVFCSQRERCAPLLEAFSETLELLEAVKKSLRRRRTVDVHFDSGSERGVFKSQMTAIGCGVLILMLFGMVGYLIVAQLFDLPNWVLHVARFLWITPLVLFLFAQLLLPFARSREKH